MREHIASTTGGGVGGPRTKAYNCMKTGGTWRCYTRGPGGCSCHRPITPSSLITSKLNECVKKAKLSTESQKMIAIDRLATTQYGYSGFMPGQKLLDNNARSGGYQAKQIRNKYDYLQKDMINECEKKHLGQSTIERENRGESVP